jgi:hypothetical protein
MWPGRRQLPLLCAAWLLSAARLLRARARLRTA